MLYGKSGEHQAEWDMLKDFYLKLQPYQYFKLYLEAHRMAMTTDIDHFKKIMSSPKEYTTQISFGATGDIAFSIPELKIFNIDDDLLPLIEDTKPDYNDLKMKYPVMFINHKINIIGGTINGILLVDYEQIERDHPDLQWRRDNYDVPIRMLVVGIDHENKFEFYSLHPMIDEKIQDEHLYLEDAKEKKKMSQLAQKTKALACNILNLLVNDQKDIEEVEVKVMPGQNKKREKRGKMPLNDTITLRIGGTLKKYATEYKELRGKASVRFYVGGFWRHFESERYKKMRGQKKWIYPHYRGMKHLPERIKHFVNIKIGGK